MRSVLIGVLIAGLALLSGCKKREPVHARVDAAIAPLLPADTVALACLRLDRLKGTPFYTKYVAGKQIKALEDFGARTGLDPRESIWELVFSTNGRTSYLFIRGKFGGEFGLEPDFKANGLVRSDYKGHYLIYVGDSGVMYMNSGAAVAGKVDDLKRLVDGFDSPQRQAPEALLDLVATLPGPSHVWAASLQPGVLIPLAEAPANAATDKAVGSALLPNLARMGRRVSSLVLWGDLSQGLELHIAAVAGSDADALQLRDVLHAGLEMGRASAPSELLKLYNGVTIGAEARSVKIDIREPAELLDRLLPDLWPASSAPVR